MTRSPRARRRASAAPSLSLTVQFAVRPAGLPTPATLKRWCERALERDARVTLRFVGDREGRTLNALFRGKDHATNVLTFVYDDDVPLAGDIVVCKPVLRAEARAGAKSVTAHCAHLVIHGMLHLQGYDHERDADAARMEARESALLKSLGHGDPYAVPPGSARDARAHGTTRR